MTESSELKIYQVDSGLDERAKHEKLNFILRQIQNRIGATAKDVSTGGGGGTSDHAALTHLSYATSGHTGFSPTSHTHTHSALTNLDYASSGHTGFAPTAHVHAEADVTNLVTDLAGKSPIAHTHVHSTLTSLVAPADDHTQYLPISGTRAMDGQLGPKVVTLTDAAIIVTNATLGNHFRVTLGGNRTLGNPTGAYDGQILRYEIKQDGTGGRTLTLGNKMIKPSNVPDPILTTTIAATDMLQLVYNSSEDKYVITGFLTNIYGV